MGGGGSAPPHLCISVPLHLPVLHLPLCSLPIYEPLHMGESAEEHRKGGHPLTGAPSLFKLQPVARKLHNPSSRKRDDEKHRTE